MLVGDDYVGAVMSDLSGRRGRVARHRAGERRAHAGPGRGARRSRSAGTRSTCGPSRTAPARFSRAYARHEPMPPQLAERVREQARDGLGRWRTAPSVTAATRRSSGRRAASAVRRRSRGGGRVRAIRDCGYADDLINRCAGHGSREGRRSEQWRRSGAGMTVDGRLPISFRGAGAAARATAGQTAATYALASAAYRDNPVEEILKANNEWHKSAVKAGRKLVKLFRAEPGRGVLPGGAATACWAAAASRSSSPSAPSRRRSSSTAWRPTASAGSRDTWLTAVMVLCGLLFLPGLLLWLLVFQLRTHDRQARRTSGPARSAPPCSSASASSPCSSCSSMPFSGLLGLVRARRGGRPGRRLVLGQADLRAHRQGPARPLGQPARPAAASAPRSPRRCPTSPGETAAEQLRQSLAKLTAEQQSNSVFYAGPKGILGMGTRWGSWQLAEELVAGRPGQGDPPVPQLGRHTGHPRPAAHAGARPAEHRRLPARPRYGTGSSRRSARTPRRSARPEGTGRGGLPGQGARAYSDICNKQQFGSGDRHYLGVQFTLWDGQLVITMHDHRDRAARDAAHRGHRARAGPGALPVHHQARGARRRGRQDRPVLGDPQDHAAAGRAPTRWCGSPRAPRSPGTRRCWTASAARSCLPEPFGLRHAWADKPWRHRFMADDALRAATPVLRVVHAAALRVLEENGVDTERFGNRSLVLSGRGPGRRRRGRPTCTTRRPSGGARRGSLAARRREPLPGPQRRTG